MTAKLRTAKKRQLSPSAVRANSRATAAGQNLAPSISAHDQLVAVKASLEGISAKLNGVDPTSLSDAEHDKWSDQLNAVDLAIARVRNSLLNGIVAEFEGSMTAIQASTAKTENDLAKLTKAIDVINVVSGALGVITKIISLAT